MQKNANKTYSHFLNITNYYKYIFLGKTERHVGKWNIFRKSMYLENSAGYILHVERVSHNVNLTVKPHEKNVDWNKTWKRTWLVLILLPSSLHSKGGEQNFATGCSETAANGKLERNARLEYMYRVANES